VFIPVGHVSYVSLSLLAADPQGPNADKVSPGFAGFVAVFGIALATVALIFSMVRHLRKVRYSTPPDVPPHVQAARDRAAGEPGASSPSEASGPARGGDPTAGGGLRTP